MRIFRTKNTIFLIFVISFLVGIMYVHVTSEYTAADSRIFSEYFLKRFLSAEVDMKTYVPYLLRLRILPLFVVTGLAFTKIRRVSGVAFLTWTGFTLGLLLTIASYAMGFRGIVMCFITLLPHMLFYMPAYVVVLWYSFSYPNNVWNYQKTIFVLFMIGIGIVLESCVSITILKDFFGV